MHHNSTLSAPPIEIEGELCRVVFDRFDLAAYDRFLAIKRLPESQIHYDWQTDAYTVTTPARFAPRLDASLPVPERIATPLAGHLFDYQAWAVRMALDAKRFALWFDTGLGKTATFLEFARQVRAMTTGRVLILSPLAVIPQTTREAERFYGETLPIAHLHTREGLVRWCAEGPEPIAITNYEKFIPGVIPELRLIAGLIADESGILKTGGGKIKWNLIKSARGIEYKLSCTATPAPNEAMEYASQAAFLEKLRTEGEILWTFFQRDKYGTWTVKPHARAAFYRFMASWSLYLRNPAVFGFRDILAGLPNPEVFEERIEITDDQRRLMQEVLIETGTGLFIDERVSVTVRQKLNQIARGFRYSGTGKARTVERVESRKVDRVAEIVRSEVAAGHQVLVWTTFDEEAAILSERLEGIAHTALTGKMTDDARLGVLDLFRDGNLRVLISKPQLIGYGLNLQFVTSMVFAGFDDSFERMYQAVRRAYRFGQTETVRVFTPYVPELEGMVFENVRQKETRFLAEVEAQEQQYLDALRDSELLTIGVEG